MNQYFWSVIVCCFSSFSAKFLEIFTSFFLVTILFLYSFYNEFCVPLIVIQMVWFIKYFWKGLYFTSTALYIQHIWVASIFIKCSGHVKKNPDPKPNSWERFCFCHRNLNKLVAHNLVKLPLLQVYISVTNILCYMPLRNLLMPCFFG